MSMSLATVRYLLQVPAAARSQEVVLASRSKCLTGPRLRSSSLALRWLVPSQLDIRAARVILPDHAVYRFLGTFLTCRESIPGRSTKSSAQHIGRILYTTKCLDCTLWC